MFLRFRNRIALLDGRSDEFLNTRVQLGGLLHSGTRQTLRHCKLGYKSSGSVAGVRRKQILACGWPAEFVFDHEQKITLFMERGCPINAIPHRGGKPYLWEKSLLRVGDGTIAIALVDDQQRSPFSQSKTLLERFSPTLSYLPPYSSLLIITGSPARQRRYQQVVTSQDLMRAQSGVPIPIEPYRIEPSIKVFAHADPATIHKHEQIPTRDRPRSPTWPSNLATIR